jgi:acetyl esterase/lipase
LLLKDRGLPGPAAQVLVYPMLDDRTVLREVDGRHHRLWDQASNRYGWTSYLANTPGAPEVPEHAAPARRVDLSGLPPTWIGVGTLDLFHDEDAAYAARLRAAGVDTTFEVVEGAFHGFDAVSPGAEVCRHFTNSFTSAMEAALRRP